MYTVNALSNDSFKLMILWWSKYYRGKKGRRKN